MLNFFGNIIKTIAKFLSDNIMGVIVIEFVLLFVFWTIGYFSNALYGLKFDLASCWTGVGAIFGTAVMGGLQKILAYAQYKTDSIYNTPQYVKPGSSVNININNAENRDEKTTN